MLDPFRDENPEDVERLKRLQAEIHDGFKDWVRERRGSKLKGDDADALLRRVLDRASAASSSGWSTAWANCAACCRPATAPRCTCR